MLKVELHLISDNRDQERLGKALQAIEQYITISDIDADYSNSRCVVYGTTECGAGEVMVRTMQDIGRPMLSKCITNYDLLELSTRPQQHVPTEDEILAMRISRNLANTIECDGGFACNPDICPIHGT
jgi:hypothetical protein